MVDLNFGAIENLRKLFKKVDQETQLIESIKKYRMERILFLARLPSGDSKKKKKNKVKVNETLTRMVGFFVT